MKNLVRLLLLLAALAPLAACQTDEESASMQAAKAQLTAMEWTKTLYVSPQWDFAGVSDDGRSISFVHKATKKTKAGVVTSSMRTEHKDLVGGVRSKETAFEYNCKEVKSRKLGITTYKNPNLEGKIKTVVLKNQSWSLEAPNSAGARAMANICAPAPKTATAVGQPQEQPTIFRIDAKDVINVKE